MKEGCQEGYRQGVAAEARENETEPSRKERREKRIGRAERAENHNTVALKKARSAANNWHNGCN